MSLQSLNASALAGYQEWEQRTGPGMRARYSDFLPREPLFEIRPNDIVVTLPGYRIAQTSPGLLSVSTPQGQNVAIRGLHEAELAKALELLDGHTSVIELSRSSPLHWPLQAWQALLQILLGTAVDLPAVFSSLASVLRLSELVRFPDQPPHSLWRNYWENATDVRRHLPKIYQALEGSAAFRAELAHLHVLATIGSNGHSYYGGYGLVPTVPGGYREIGVQTAIPASLVNTLDHWSSLLGTESIQREGEITTPRGLVMCVIREQGTIVEHRATGTMLFALLDEARLFLTTVRQSGARDHASDMLRDLAYFHQIFINAHPFANINNSIAMNLVNDCLLRAGFGRLPHLLLDYLAQRLPPDRYATAFAAAVRLHVLPEDDRPEWQAALDRSAALYRQYRQDRDNTTQAI